MQCRPGHALSGAADDVLGGSITAPASPRPSLPAAPAAREALACCTHHSSSFPATSMASRSCCEGGTGRSFADSSAACLRELSCTRLHAREGHGSRYLPCGMPSQVP